MMGAVIGCMPLYDDEKESYWMVPGYMQMLQEQGAIPMMLPLTEDKGVLDYFLTVCDGFLLTGGQDVSTWVYGETPSRHCGVPCELRDKMESYILRQAVRLEKSVLGICRGVQLMNACYGGTLYQDLSTEYGGTIDHHMTPPYDRVSHFVTVSKDTPLYRFLGTEKIGVNSYHHQAIKTLSPQFQEMAVSEDGITEAIYMPGQKFVIGVQWHPEFFYKTDRNSVKIVEAFVQSMQPKI